MKVSLISSFVFLLGIVFLSPAQEASENLRYNRSVLKYYNGNDLEELETLAPDQYDQLRNYFVSSYTIEKLNCENCAIDMNDFFNQEMFNIVSYENLRDASASIQFLFKDKYVITLLPANELTVLLDGLSASDMLDVKYNRPFPVLIETGDLNNDYALYIAALRGWIKDFPDEYRTILAAQPLRISISEFTAYSQDRRDAVLSHSTGYIITE